MWGSLAWRQASTPQIAAGCDTIPKHQFGAIPCSRNGTRPASTWIGNVTTKAYLAIALLNLTTPKMVWKTASMIPSRYQTLTATAMSTESKTQPIRTMRCFDICALSCLLLKLNYSLYEQHFGIKTNKQIP